MAAANIGALHGVGTMASGKQIKYCGDMVQPGLNIKQSFSWVRERLQTSIWPIPVICCLLMFLLALLMINLERQFPALLPGLDSFVMSVAAARQLLGIIASSVLSVGGVAFSMTMVALTLTSGQYGPKILRQFLGDSSSKLSLGLYLGTCVYALITLFGYVESDRPQITVVVALLLTILALAAFIQFIHRTATDLQADQIIQRIGGQLRQSFEEWAADDNLAGRADDSLAWRRFARGRPGCTATAETCGYVQSVDYEGLAQWCEHEGCVALVRVRAGDFLLETSRTCTLYGTGCDTLAERLDEINRFFLTGPLRTPVQDCEYPITQLNQLAARALSPGINDPGTAITCLDWFCMGLARIIDRDLPGKICLDAQGKPRLMVRRLDFDGITKAFYAPFRQFSRGNIPVSISLLESLVRLARLTDREDRLRQLARHGELIWHQVEEMELASHDIADVRQRYRMLLRVCGAGLTG